MTNNLYNSTYIDRNGNKIVYGDNVNSIIYYNASDDGWDRTGGGIASWYLEVDIPNDGFLGPALSDDIWDFFKYRGLCSGIVNNGLHLSISGSDARGGVSSENKWKLSGNFDIKSFLDEGSYNNEYRSGAAVGMSVSVDDSHVLRISKYFDGEEIFYKTQYVDNNRLKYFGWFDLGDSLNISNTGTTCFRIKRDEDVIRSYVGNGSDFTEVGTLVSGTSWSGDAFVCLELETDQYNTLGSTFTGFTASGVVVPSGVFTNSTRGFNKEFPSNAVVLADDYGVSIVDYDEMSLWMRFNYGVDLFCNNQSPVMSASNGCIYFTTTSGLRCADFINDKMVKYNKDYTAYSLDGLSSRNIVNSFDILSNKGFIAYDNITGVSSKYFGGHSYLGVSTDNGVGLLIDDIIGKKCDTTLNTKAVRLFDNGYMVWNEYTDGVNTGTLSVRENISNLILDPLLTFSRSYYYSLSTTPALSSCDINNIYLNSEDGIRIVSCGDGGMDYIYSSEVEYYGPSYMEDPFTDGVFSSYIGVNWIRNPNVNTFNSFDVFRTNTWSSILGGNSVCFSMLSGRFTYTGDYDEIVQEVDLTNVGSVFYDLKFYKPAGGESNKLIFSILLDDTLLVSYNDSDSFEKYSRALDLYGYSGLHTIRFRIQSVYSGSCLSTYKYYLSNVRASDASIFNSIIPTTSSSFLDAYILYSNTEKKLFFSTGSGFGSIDLPTKTLDFFNNIGEYVPLAGVLSVNFTEDIDV